MSKQGPPQNLEAERALLGSILQDSRSLDVAVEIVGKNGFLSNFHRLIFAKMLAVYAKKQEINSITVADELEKDNQLKQVGGIAYLTSLTDGVPGRCQLWWGISLGSSKRNLISADWLC